MRAEGGILCCRPAAYTAVGPSSPHLTLHSVMLRLSCQPLCHHARKVPRSRRGCHDKRRHENRPRGLVSQPYSIPVFSYFWLEWRRDPPKFLLQFQLADLSGQVAPEPRTHPHVGFQARRMNLGWDWKTCEPGRPPTKQAAFRRQTKQFFKVYLALKTNQRSCVLVDATHPQHKHTVFSSKTLCCAVDANRLRCAEAAGGGHLEVLQWAKANGCEWNEQTCSKAAEGGHLVRLRVSTLLRS